MIRRSFLKLMSLLPFVGVKAGKTDPESSLNSAMRCYTLSDGNLLSFSTHGDKIRLQLLQKSDDRTCRPIGEPVSYVPGTFVSDVYTEEMVHIVYWSWNGGNSVTVLSATSGPRAADVLGWSNVVPDGSGWSYPVEVVGG